jgi:hypothetical protein
VPGPQPFGRSNISSGATGLAPRRPPTNSGDTDAAAVTATAEMTAIVTPRIFGCLLVSNCHQLRRRGRVTTTTTTTTLGHRDKQYSVYSWDPIYSSTKYYAETPGAGSSSNTRPSTRRSAATWMGVAPAATACNERFA